MPAAATIDRIPWGKHCVTPLLGPSLSQGSNSDSFHPRAKRPSPTAPSARPALACLSRTKSGGTLGVTTTLPQGCPRFFASGDGLCP